MKIVMLAVLFLAGGLVYAQPSSKDEHRAESIREKMVRAHGGEKNLKRWSTLEYSILETNYVTVPPSFTRTTYRLEPKKKQMIATFYMDGNKTVKILDGSGAWQEIDGIRMSLPEKEKEQLLRAYLFIFLTLLQDENSSLEFKHSCQYKGYSANVVLVSNPLNPAQQASMFVSDETGKVLALAWHEANEPNQMLHYTDFMEYQPLGQGLFFPVKYQVYTNGEVTAEGRMMDIKVKK